MKLKKYEYKSVTSTNDIAIKKIKQGLSKGFIVAKKQTKGRGRYGSKWIYSLVGHVNVDIVLDYWLYWLSQRDIVHLSSRHGST